MLPNNSHKIIKMVKMSAIFPSLLYFLLIKRKVQLKKMYICDRKEPLFRLTEMSLTINSTKIRQPVGERKLSEIVSGNETHNHHKRQNMLSFLSCFVITYSSALKCQLSTLTVCLAR